MLGAGALGTLFSGLLAREGLPCRLLTHHARGRDITLFADSGQGLQLHADPLGDVADGSIGHLLLTTKAYDVAPALAQAGRKLAPDAVIICCANGMGFESEVETLAPGSLLRAVTTEGALRERAHLVRHTGRGTTRVGAIHGAPEPDWFRQTLGRLPGWHWDGQVARALWHKFALNCAINPLTARLRCRNGALVDDAAYREQLGALCSETEKALRALGHWHSADTLLDSAEAVCRSTSANRSSMLQDVLAGRRTELAYLNGHLLTLAREAGLELPVNSKLVADLTDKAG